MRTIGWIAFGTAVVVGIAHLVSVALHTDPLSAPEAHPEVIVDYFIAAGAIVLAAILAIQLRRTER